MATRLTLVAALSLFISFIGSSAGAGPKLIYEGSCQEAPTMIAYINQNVQRGFFKDYKIYRGPEAKAIYDALEKLRPQDIYEGNIIIRANRPSGSAILYFGGHPPTGSFCYMEEFSSADVSKLPL